MPAAEVGGRWSSEIAEFLCALAAARGKSEPLILQGRVKAAWLRRWSAMLVCSAARSFSITLLDRRPVPGTGAHAPSAQELLRDDRFSTVTRQPVCVVLCGPVGNPNTSSPSPALLDQVQYQSSASVTSHDSLTCVRGSRSP